MKQTKVLIAGEGGQGIQLISKVLAIAAQLGGLNSLYVANYGVEQRGGVSLGFIQIGEGEIGFPKFQYADIVVIMTERAVERVREYLKPETVIIADGDLVSAESLAFVKNPIIIPASSLATSNLVSKVFNVIILGALGEILRINQNSLREALHEELKEKYKKSPEYKHFNERALEIGKRSVAVEEVPVG